MTDRSERATALALSADTLAAIKPTKDGTVHVPTAIRDGLVNVLRELARDEGDGQ